MDVNQYIEIYRVMIVIAFGVSFINWLGYTILAPWSKSALGRIVWTKLFANVLILLVPFLQVMFSEVPYRREFSIFAMGLFILAIILVGYGIYTTQLRGYLKYRRAVRKAKKQHDKERRA